MSVCRWKGVIFDLGGVVLDSPLFEIARFEEEVGLPHGTVNGVVAAGGSNGAWARHERGELDRMAFLDAFRREFEPAGYDVDVDLLLDRIDGSIKPRKRMLGALNLLRSKGWRLGAITNNWTPFDPDGLPGYFDVFVESVVEGVRKPEPDIYIRCIQRMDVDPTACVMLDDIGGNLKPAAAMGMHTIKVSTPEQALADLAEVLDIDL